MTEFSRNTTRVSTDLNEPGGSDEVDGVLAVFLHARADGQDVGVKDDVVGVKAHLSYQEAIGSAADVDLALCLGSL